MAKITKPNELFKALSGALVGLVFRSMPDGSVVVSLPPHYGRRRKYSRRQKDHQHRFKEAARYARFAARAQPIYAEFAKGTMKTAYNIALSDWFNPPVIRLVEPRQGKIVIEAVDNVIVTKLWVTILDEREQVLERGEASRGEGDVWEFDSNVDGRMILVEAWDLAGNLTKFVSKQ